jgi:uncharacterized protein (TIGR03435 family)
MISNLLVLLANHLWQTTLFVAFVWLITFGLKKNRAALRHRLWLIASIKFLLPFSLLTALGSHFTLELSLTNPSAVPVIVKSIDGPFTHAEAPKPFQDTPRQESVAALPAVSLQDSASTGATDGENWIPVVLLSLWTCGFVGSLLWWFIGWNRLRSTLRSATRVNLDFPIPVMASSAKLEPGVFGIFRPVLLMPEGIMQRLSPAEMHSVLAHEFFHVRRRDNLTAAVHMFVEAMFWFHPLVWWIKARLLEEQERACDEAVLSRGEDPQTYAESILKICEFYVTSPFICVSGIAGSDLKKRVAEIMNKSEKRDIGVSKAILLTTAVLLAIAGPIGTGILRASLRPAPRAILPAPVESTTPQQQSVRQTNTSATAPQARPQFEVTDVHSSPARPDGRTVGQMYGVTGNDKAPWLDTVLGGRYEIHNATMMELITLAYGVEPVAVVGGPSWLTSDRDRYDVVAKPPEGRTTSASVKAMLQSLLAERFKLKVRNDTRPLSVWVLSTGAGDPKMKRAASSDSSSCRIIDENERVSCRNVTMDAFAAAIRSGMLTTMPVVNSTGIEGSWDFDLNYTVTRGYFGVAENNPILDVIDKQLGLKLQLQRRPQPVLVVESVDRTPTPNVTGIEKLLPSPEEFEVASIRPCEFVNPATRGGETGSRFSPSGQLSTGCLSLQRHIAIAFNRPGRMEGAPGWLNERYFNITAKAPVGVRDEEDPKYKVMLRNLLAVRFKLAFHYEEQPFDVYELVADKPKLKQADPAGLSECKVNGGAGFLVGVPSVVTCQNVTVTQFAESLGNVGDTYDRPGTRLPVVDATGLQGAWDFTVSYWQVPGPRANIDDVANRTGSPNIFDAFEKQLGLKLKKAKGTRKFFVIDHIEENPTEN